MRPNKRARSSASPPSSPSSSPHQPKDVGTTHTSPSPSSSSASASASQAPSTSTGPGATASSQLRASEANKASTTTSPSPKGKGKEKQPSEAKATRPATPPSAKRSANSEAGASPSRKEAKRSPSQSASAKSPSIALSNTEGTNPSATNSTSATTAAAASSPSSSSSSVPPSPSSSSSSSPHLSRSYNRSPAHDRQDASSSSVTNTGGEKSPSGPSPNVNSPEGGDLPGAGYSLAETARSPWLLTVNAPQSPQSPTAKRLSQVIRRNSNEGSPVRTVGGAAMAPTSPGERSTEQQQKKPPIGSAAPLSVADLTGQLDEEHDVDPPELVSELSAGPGNSSMDSETEEGEEVGVILTHGGQQVSVKIPQPLLLTSTIARGPFHQCGTARRVKVYRLEGESWIDNGTGYCAGVYDEVHDEALLVARVEDSCIMIDGAAPDPRKQAVLDGQNEVLPNGELSRDAAGLDPPPPPSIQPYYLIVSEDMDVDEHIMLNTQVVKEDVYQKQQDTLVVWTESDGTDMALSFQEADGCQEVWEFITEVQRHFHANQAAASAAALSDPPTPDAGSPTSGGDLSQSNWGMGMVMLIDSTAFNPPEPSLGKLEEIEQVLKETASKGPLAREKVAEWLVRADYLRKLVPVFQDAEDLENVEDLQCLCTIMQTIVMLNDSAIVETIIQDDLFIDIAGMFEYDPEFPTLKASYRDYLRNTARFKSVIDIEDIKIVTKIHQVYRLQYLKDVILARILDDAMFSVLNSWIFFHQVDIVNYCSGSIPFLQRVFSVCEPDSGEPEEKKHDAVFFIQSLCAMGKQVQMPVRVGLYRSLTDHGVLSLLEYGLFESGHQRVQNAAAEMLMVLVEFDPSIIRSHTLDQEDKGQTTFVTRLSEVLHAAKDLGFKAQMSEVMRTMFDCPSPDSAPQSLNATAAAANRNKVDPDRFFAHLYEADIDRLFGPLKRLPDYKTLDVATVRFSVGAREHSALLAHLCELLCNCVLQHGFRSQYYVITSEIAVHVATLLFAKEKHMKLAAIKLFRACLASNNQFINRHFLKHDIFGAILVLARRECHRDNLILSACIEFFEHLKKEKSKIVMDHLIEKHYQDLEVLSQNRFAGQCFSAIFESARKPNAPQKGAAGGADEGERGSDGGEGKPRQSSRSRAGSTTTTFNTSGLSTRKRLGVRNNDASRRTAASASGGGGGFVRPAQEEEEADENAYFDDSDDEDEPAIAGPSSASRSKNAATTGSAPRLKRSDASVAPSAAAAVAPSPATSSTSGGLAGIGMYSDDDDEDEEDAGEAASKDRLISSNGGDGSAARADADTSTDPDSLLLSLPSRASGKRRREEAEEDDFGLERLAKRSHAQADADTDASVGAGAPEGIEGPPAAAAAAAAPAPPALTRSSSVGSGGGFILEDEDEDTDEALAEADTQPPAPAPATMTNSSSSSSSSSAGSGGGVGGGSGAKRISLGLSSEATKRIAARGSSSSETETNKERGGDGDAETEVPTAEDGRMQET